MKTKKKLVLCQNGWTNYYIEQDKGKHLPLTRVEFDLAKMTKKERGGLERWMMEILMKINRMENR